MSPVNISSSSTSDSSLSHAIFEQFFQVVKYPHHQQLIQELNQYFLADPSQLPRLLNIIINQLKQHRIPVTQAREITAAACCIVAQYVKTYTYKQEDESHFKQVMSLLNALIYSAVKIPLPETLLKEADLISGSLKPMTPSSPPLEEEDDTVYGIVALMGIKALLEKANFNNDFLLFIAILYCLDWSQIPEDKQVIMSDLAQSLGFIAITPEETEFVPLLKKYGWRKVLGMAEFQYRKNQYINLKSRVSETQEIEHSPLETIEENLKVFHQKLKDSLSALIIFEGANLDFGSGTQSYLNYLNQPCSPQSKLMMVFHALNKLYIDGIYKNYKARCHIEQGISFGSKAKELYKVIFDQWSHKLSDLARLTVSAKIITTPIGQKMKKTVLDWPLSSFFPDQHEKKGKITQTVLREKVDELSVSDCADLLILLYCNVQETANPLGQVHNLYSSLREKLTLTTQDSQFIQHYLQERGFSPHQVSYILESQEDT